MAAVGNGAAAAVGNGAAAAVGGAVAAVGNGAAAVALAGGAIAAPTAAVGGAAAGGEERGHVDAPEWVVTERAGGACGDDGKLMRQAMAAMRRTVRRCRGRTDTVGNAATDMQLTQAALGRAWAAPVAYLTSCVLQWREAGGRPSYVPRLRLVHHVCECVRVGQSPCYRCHHPSLHLQEVSRLLDAALSLEPASQVVPLDNATAVSELLAAIEAGGHVAVRNASHTLEVL